MSHNSFGHLFRITTWGESHGPAIGCVIDGCPPGIPITEAEIQAYLDKRKPGQSKYTTQRKEPDTVEILSGVFETEDGEMLRIQTGDVLVTPKGSKGKWHIHETIVKFYAIYQS